MASIPGYCPHCGCIFDGTGGIHVENATSVTVSGSRMTCPNCGRMANLVEGTFNERGRGLELVSGPPLTRVILDRLQELARRVEADQITPEQIIEEAEAVAPEVAQVLRRVPLSSVLSIFLSLVALYMAYRDQQDSRAFQEEVLELLRGPAATIESTVNEIPTPHPNVSKPGHKPERPSQQKVAVPPPTPKPKSDRRKRVNKTRRDELKLRRQQFPRRPRG